MKKIQASILKRQYRASDQLFKETLGILIVRATSSLKSAINLASEKGASSWVMARPLLWNRPAQNRFSGCDFPSLWVGAPWSVREMCLWSPFQCGACHNLYDGWPSYHDAQRSGRRNSGSHEGCWVSCWSLIYSLSTARLSSSRRPTSKMMPGVTSGPRVSGEKTTRVFRCNGFYAICAKLFNQKP